MKILRTILWIPRVVLFAALGAGIWVFPCGGIVVGLAMRHLWGWAWYVQVAAGAVGVAYWLVAFYLMLDGTVGSILCWVGGL